MKKALPFNNDMLCENGIKPTLLLHSCCAPCSSSVLEMLCECFEVTVFYYNPNIWPEEEYAKRHDEQKRFCESCRRFPRDPGRGHGLECGSCD